MQLNILQIYIKKLSNTKKDKNTDFFSICIRKNYIIIFI